MPTKKLYFLLLFVFSSITLLAQEQLTVNVNELLTLKPVANKIIYIQNINIGFLDSAKTDKLGKVSFNGLPLNGVYKVYTLESDNYFAESSANVELRSNNIRSISLSLPSKKTNVLKEVEIRSHNTTLINTTNAEVSSEMNSKEIEELPVEGRDITQMLYRLPNVSLATGFFSEAPNVSINGSNGLYNSYLIDGMDNNERFLGGQMFPTPVGFARNVTVLTNNYSVEYGNTANGLINITPKSGSDSVKGEVYFLVRPGAALDGKTNFPLRDLSGNLINQGGFQRYQEGFDVGGPIVKNKTFYFINYERTNDIKDVSLSSPALGVNTTVRNTNRWDLISAKIDQHWNNHWNSSLRANIGLESLGFQGGGLGGGVTFPSAGYYEDRNSLLIAAKTSYTKGDFTSESNVEYSRFHWNYARPINPASPDVSVLDPSGQAAAFLGNPGYAFNSYQNAVQAQQKFILRKTDHTFKFGLELMSSHHQLYGGGDANGSYTVMLDSPQLAAINALHKGSALTVYDIPSSVSVISYSAELRPAAFGKTQNIYTAYAEDQWSITNRLNATIGLRYDYDNLSKGGASHGDYNNIAPRVSLNYRLSDRSSLRAGYGIFYDKILYTIYSDALQQNSVNTDYLTELQSLASKGILPGNTNINGVTFNGNVTVSANNVTYLKGPTSASFPDGSNNVFSNERRVLNPNGYQNPYSQQMSVGYQYQLSRTILFYADVVYNRSYNLPRLYYLNAPATWNSANHPGQARAQASADSTRPVPIYTDGTGSFSIINGQKLYGVARDVVYTDMGGKSTYYGLSINLQKEKANDNYSFRLIYTLSSLRNNTEDVNFRAQDQNNYAAEWGPSINDRRHIINAIFNYFPVKNLTLTIAALLQSGQPINRVPNATNFVVVDNEGNPVLDNSGNVQHSNDLNGDGNSFGEAYVGNSDRYPGASRNIDRLPWSRQFDFSAQYAFHLHKHSNERIELRMDIFNILNTVNLSGYANNATQSNQIQFGPPGAPIVTKNAGPPREFQFGLRYAF